MIAKANKPLTAKQASFIQYYADPGSETFNNAMQSAIRAGYSIKTANNSIRQVLGNIGVIEGIRQYKDKIGRKMEHNRDIAIKLLTDNLARCTTKADNGDIQAAGAITGIIRELNAISALHKSTIITEPTAEPDQTEAEQQATDEACKVYKLHISQARKKA